MLAHLCLALVIQTIPLRMVKSIEKEYYIMNIFYLHEDPTQCAQWHIDKHVVKMPTEYAQLLSTAHRMLDGELYYVPGKRGMKKRWRLPDDRDDNIYQAGHYGHPSAVWVRESKSNYNMLFRLYTALLGEYDYRYNEKG